MTKTTPDDSGFTLVELTIVMVIVSVLTAIAIPVMQSQKQKSYKSAMAADLHSVIVTELAWSSGNNNAYTTDMTLLGGEGYKATSQVTAHVKLVGTSGYLACTKHSAYSGGWLVYDSASGSTAIAAADCA